MRAHAVGRVLAIMAAAALASAGGATARTGNVRDVPDPAIIAENGRYYVFSTGPGIAGQPISGGSHERDPVARRLDPRWVARLEPQSNRQ